MAAPTVTLTDMQREVVQLLADGHSCPQIGRRLHLTTAAVRSRVKKAQAANGVVTAAGLVALAIRGGLI